MGKLLGNLAFYFGLIAIGMALAMILTFGLSVEFVCFLAIALADVTGGKFLLYKLKSEKPIQ